MSAPYLALVISLSAMVASEVSAEPCAEDAAPSGAGRQWFYVRLVNAAKPDDPVQLDFSRSAVATQPPAIDEYENADRTTNCFASAVESSTRVIRIHAKAVGFQPKECEVGDGWGRFTSVRPYECRLVPKKNGVVTDTGLIKLAEVPAAHRQEALDDMIEFVLSLDETERAATLNELGSTFDVRSGVLGQRLLAHMTPRCTKSACIDHLAANVPKSMRDFLVANKAAVTAEEVLGTKREIVAKNVSDRAAAKDVLLIFDDPSRDLPIGDSKEDQRKFAAFVLSRLPADRAGKVLSITKAGFTSNNLVTPP
jgi:hypothetical protein